MSNAQYGALAVWITIATLAAAAVLRFGALEEAKERLVVRVADQEQRIERQDERIRALESSRRSDDKIAELTAKLAALEAKIDTLIESSRRR